MENLTPQEIWTVVLAVASAIVLLSNAAEKVAKVVQAAKAPNQVQDGRLAELEAWRKKVDQALLNDLGRFEALDTGERVTQRALLALLDHGIDGNNIDQMRQAKEALQNQLNNR